MGDADETAPSQYDTKPDGVGELGRLDDRNFPVFYASTDLEICAHEVRMAVADQFHVGTFELSTTLRALDFCSEGNETGSTEFESINLAMHYLFRAEPHSYPYSRALARAAKNAGFHALIYPSYFSSVKDNDVENIAIFGRPVAEQQVKVVSLNRMALRRASYDLTLGPTLPRFE